ncbi:cell wall protein DAN4-like, partial [Clarias magur]
VEPLYFKAFKNCIRIGILRLSKGSTIIDSNVYFNSSGPNVTPSDVKNTLINGLSSLNFTVIPDSISVSQTL